MKAISSFISTVMIIAIIAGVVGLVSVQLTGLLKSSTGITSNSSESLTQCSFGHLEIKDVGCTMTPSQSANLTGYWKFDDGSGSWAVDVSGRGNNGSLVNMSTVGNASSGWSNGCMFGNCLRFDGTNDLVNVSTNISSLPITVSAWIRFEKNNIQQFIVDFRPDRGRMQFRIASNNSLEWVVSYTGGTTISLYGPALNLNTWYYVAGQANGTEQALYVDGERVAYATFSLTGLHDPLQQRRYPIIGANSDFIQHFFNGTIDDVQIYNRSLSQTGIIQNYLNGAGIRIQLANNGAVNLGKNFMVNYRIAGASNSTQLNLPSDLVQGAVTSIRVNASDSGVLNQVRVTSVACPSVFISKDVNGYVC